MDGGDVERIAAQIMSTRIVAPPRPEEANAAGVQERQARAMVERAVTPLGRKYAIEDLERRDKFRLLRPEVRNELLASLRAKGAAA
jgi:hypothetical protein